MLRQCFLIILSGALLVACSAHTPSFARAATPAITELVKTDIVVGAGDPIASGQTAIVHYTGWLYDEATAEKKGRKFDSSRDRSRPFRFKVGAGRAIKGWDQGVLGMAVGGRRLLVVPARLGYGDAGAGGVIPPRATLVFEVELLGIQPTG